MTDNEKLAKPKRHYRGSVQAEVAALSRQRIIEATLMLYGEQWIDEMTLDQIPKRAGVTVQTIIRHFGSREQLLAAAGRAGVDQGQQQRDEAPVGDVAGAVRNLLEQYEVIGERLLRVLAQEGRYPELDILMNEGCRGH